MTFSFPNLPKLSLWDIGCLYTGQNATDDKPTNETRHKLAELAQAVFDGRLWVEFHPDVGFDFVSGFMPAAARARVDTEWRKLDQVTVRREDWQRYERAPLEFDQRHMDAGAEELARAAGFQNPALGSIDFVSLDEALSFIADAIDATRGNANIDDVPMWRTSEAAKVLHERLTNTVDSRLQWYEVHATTGKPLLNDSVADEGMAIIVYAAGWYDRQMAERNDHILGCIRAGLDPKTEPMSRDPDKGPWKWSERFLREHRIGFQRIELANLMQMPFGAVTEHDRYEAQALLARPFAQLEHIAWAMVILAPSAPAQGEERYRQIHGVTQWLESLGLQFRTCNGLPASLPRGVHTHGTDVREYQYLAVADVRAAGLSANCWPKAADRRSNVEGTVPLGNQATKIVELSPGLTPAHSLAYRIAAAFVEIPYGWTEEAKNARARYESVVAQHLDQMSAMAQDGAILLVTAEGLTTHDVSIGYLRSDDAKSYLGKFGIPWDVSIDDAGAEEQERTTVADLVWRIASYRADDAAIAEEARDDDGLRRTLRIAMRIHERNPERAVGVIEQLAEMATAGTITVRGIACATTNPSVEAISACPQAWWLTNDDAQQVVAALWPQVQRYTLTAAVETIAKRVHGTDYLAEYALEKSLRTEIETAIGCGELPVNERRNREIWLNEYDVDEWLARARKPYRLGLSAQTNHEQEEMANAGRLPICEVAALLAKETGTDAARWESTLVAEIRGGALPLKNPRTLADFLPYAVPKNLRTFYDRVDAIDINNLLDRHPEWRVTYRLPVAETRAARIHVIEPEHPLSKPPLQQQHQESEILRKIRDLGVDPKNLPKQKPGKPGIKSAVRTKLPFSEKVFDLAWERLRKNGEIADTK
ncbi:hypothetical protein [Burkholderia cepacia]|uniref:hypothetical protein n=1 Tax=Burkholderia cepacia TaxID=292 RepID=UPI0020C734ED|nr:hypothetical protein [Burkholderia cepacia]